MDPEPHTTYVRVFQAESVPVTRDSWWVAHGPLNVSYGRTPEDAIQRYLANPGVQERMEEPIFQRGRKVTVFVPDGGQHVILKAEDVKRWDRVADFVYGEEDLPEDARRKAAGDVVAAVHQAGVRLDEVVTSSEDRAALEAQISSPSWSPTFGRPLVRPAPRPPQTDIPPHLLRRAAERQKQAREEASREQQARWERTERGEQ